MVELNQGLRRRSSNDVERAVEAKDLADANDTKKDAASGRGNALKFGFFLLLVSTAVVAYSQMGTAKISKSIKKTVKTLDRHVECSEKLIADVAFLSDASSSIGEADYDVIRGFMAEVVNGLPGIDDGDVKVSLTKFSSVEATETIFDFDAHSTTADVVNAIQTHSFVKTYGTYTGSAMKLVRDTILNEPSSGSRDGVPKVLVVITDGNPSNTEEKDLMRRQAVKMAGDGVNILAIGVGDVSRSNLKKIAAGQRDHVFHVDNFAGLSDILGEITTKVCRAATPATCALGETDIVFVADASTSVGADNYELVKDFMGDVVTTLGPAVEGGAIRVGLLRYSTVEATQTEFALDAHASRADINAAIALSQYPAKKGTYTGNALMEVYRNFIHDETKGARRTASKIVVIITDGHPADNDEVIAQSSALRASDVKVISVGVTADVSYDSLLLMAQGKADRVFSVDSFEGLEDVVGSIAHSVCKADCEAGITDFVILADGSTSVGSANWDVTINFLKDLIEDMPGITGASSKTRVAMVRFGRQDELLEAFDFNAHSHVGSIRARIGQVPWTGNPGTYTGHAMQYVLDNLMYNEAKGARPLANKILMVVTDGHAADYAAVAAAASGFRARGTTTVSIGVTDDIDNQQLMLMSNQKQHLVHRVDDFAGLSSLIAALIKTVCDPACKPIRTDVILLADASSSVGAENYSFLTDFLAEFVLRIPGIANGDVRVGMARYSTKEAYTVEFGAKEHESAGAIAAAIRASQYPDTRGTYTGYAMQQVYSDFMFKTSKGTRQGAKKVLVVVTDGNTADYQAVVDASKAFRRAGVATLSIGVTDNIDRDQLLIMSHGKESRVFGVGDFEGLRTITDNLVRAVCMPACVAPATDLVLLADASSSIDSDEYDVLSDFMADLAEGLAGLDTGAVRVALAQFSNADDTSVIFDFTANSNSAEVVAAIKTHEKTLGTGTETGNAMHLVIDTLMFNTNAGARDSASKVLIVLTDGNPSDHTLVDSAAVELQARGVYTVSVGIGNGIDMRQLQIMANENPDRVYMVEDFEGLSALLTSLTLAVCGAPDPEPRTGCDVAGTACECAALGGGCGWSWHAQACTNNARTSCNECPSMTICPGQNPDDACNAAADACECAALKDRGCGWSKTTQSCGVTKVTRSKTTCDECESMEGCKGCERADSPCECATMSEFCGWSTGLQECRETAYSGTYTRCNECPTMEGCPAAGTGCAAATNACACAALEGCGWSTIFKMCTITALTGSTTTCNECGAQDHCPASSVPVVGRFHFDNIGELYINGVQVASSDDWKVGTGEFSTSAALPVHVAVRLEDVGQAAGILGQLDVDGVTHLTDGSWTCKAGFNANYLVPGVVAPGNLGVPATEIARNSESSIWSTEGPGPRPNVAHNAYWIDSAKDANNVMTCTKTISATGCRNLATPCECHANPLCGWSSTLGACTVKSETGDETDCNECPSIEGCPGCALATDACACGARPDCGWSSTSGTCTLTSESGSTTTCDECATMEVCTSSCSSATTPCDCLALGNTCGWSGSVGACVEGKTTDCYECPDQPECPACHEATTACACADLPYANCGWSSSNNACVFGASTTCSECATLPFCCEDKGSAGPCECAALNDNEDYPGIDCTWSSNLGKCTRFAQTGSYTSCSECPTQAKCDR